MFDGMGTTRVERFRAARRDPALAIVEGFHALKHALRFGADVIEAVTPDARALERLAADLAPELRESIEGLAVTIAPDEFATLSPATIPTQVIALARRPPFDVDAVLATPDPAPIIWLEEPTSPFNVGAAVRVGAAACATALLTSGPLDPWAPTALRAAAGLHWALPVGRLDAWPVCDRALVAVDPDGEPLDRARIPPRAVLVFGTERDGLSAMLVERADVRVRIPMRAGVSSLNLATAVAAVLYAGRGSTEGRPS